MKTTRFFLILIMIVSFSFLASAQSDNLSVKQGGKEIFSFTKTGGGYKAASARLFLDVVKDKAGYRFIMGGREYRVKEKENGYKIYDPSGSMIYKIKEKEGKIKVMKSEDDPSPWAIKFKGDHYKVVSGERELGKIKFYNDKKKMKVKDAKGAEVCEASANRLRAAPAVALFQGLKESNALIIFAALSLVNR